LLVAETTDLGFKVIINNEYLGMLYKNEVFRTLEPGEKITGYIRKIREDRKIDVSLQKSGYAEIPDAADQILAKLKASNGILPLTDNSSPEEIYAILEMSKKTFKKAIGNLYRNGVVQLMPNAIKLNDQKD